MTTKTKRTTMTARRSVACPKCGARKGEACRSTRIPSANTFGGGWGGGYALDREHAERISAARKRAVELFDETTYTIEISDDSAALVQSSRAGLWTAAPGESSGWSLEDARRAAAKLLSTGTAAAVRLVSETTGERIAV